MLKKDTFNYAGQSTSVSELSGLQRIEYMTVIQKETAIFDNLPADTPESDSNMAFASLRLRINAWLVAASLWHDDKQTPVETLQQTVLTDWSGPAIAECSQMVLTLSDMLAPDTDPDDSGVDASPAEGKDSPAKP